MSDHKGTRLPSGVSLRGMRFCDDGSTDPTSQLRSYSMLSRDNDDEFDLRVLSYCHKFNQFATYCVWWLIRECHNK